MQLPLENTTVDIIVTSHDPLPRFFPRVVVKIYSLCKPLQTFVTVVLISSYPIHSPPVASIQSAIFSTALGISLSEISSSSRGRIDFPDQALHQLLLAHEDRQVVVLVRLARDFQPLQKTPRRRTWGCDYRFGLPFAA